MQYFPAALQDLADHFARLPGIGGKTAQRLAFYMLGLPEAEAQDFADAIMQAKKTVHTCPVCQNLTDREVCPICDDEMRNRSVICVVADELESKPVQENRLYLSEDGFDLPFSAQRALSRNRIIHTLPPKVFVAQCTLERGGTWDGTTRDLRFLWSQVYCFADGSAATAQLVQLGAKRVTAEELSDISALKTDMIDLF